MGSYLIEFLQRHLIIGEDITIGQRGTRVFSLEMVFSSFSVKVRFCSPESLNHSALIRLCIHVCGGFEMLVAQDILSHFEMAQIDNGLSQRVAEHMCVDVGTELASNVAQRGLKRGIRQRMSFPFAQSHPECGDRSIHVTFLAEIALVERPEVVCHWHAMLIASSLQKDSDCLRALGYSPTRWWIIRTLVPLA
jgi:hypothetical protein